MIKNRSKDVNLNTSFHGYTFHFMANTTTSVSHLLSIKDEFRLIAKYSNLLEYVEEQPVKVFNTPKQEILTPDEKFDKLISKDIKADMLTNNTESNITSTMFVFGESSVDHVSNKKIALSIDDKRASDVMNPYLDDETKEDIINTIVTETDGKIKPTKVEVSEKSTTKLKQNKPKPKNKK